MLIKAFAGLALSLLIAPPLLAQTLAQKEYMARQESALAAVKPDVDAACGTTLSTTIDWPSFLKDEIGFHSVASSCADPLAMMRSMCADPLAKKAIAEKIQAYTCSFGGPGKRAMSLDHGTLHMDVDWDAVNADEFTHAWFGDHL